MPLDGHSFLVSQGWGGKGTGLRQGAITRPIAVSQKKSLAGLGKDRDEAFPFWDHLFSAAAKSIQVKILSDDDDDDDDSSKDEASTSKEAFKRTATGILCNRRPISGTPASSGTATPDVKPSQYSLLSTAKREAAKRGLYARFFRGPVLGPDSAFENNNDNTVASGSKEDMTVVDVVQTEETIIEMHVSPVIEGNTKKKRPSTGEASDEEEREKKRRKKERSEKKAKKSKSKDEESNEEEREKKRRKKERSEKKEKKSKSKDEESVEEEQGNKRREKERPEKKEKTSKSKDEERRMKKSKVHDSDTQAALEKEEKRRLRREMKKKAKTEEQLDIPSIPPVETN